MSLADPSDLIERLLKEDVRLFAAMRETAHRVRRQTAGDEDQAGHAAAPAQAAPSAAIIASSASLAAAVADMFDDPNILQDEASAEVADMFEHPTNLQDDASAAVTGAIRQDRPQTATLASGTPASGVSAGPSEQTNIPALDVSSQVGSVGPSNGRRPQAPAEFLAEAPANVTPAERRLTRKKRDKLYIELQQALALNAQRQHLNNTLASTPLPVGQSMGAAHPLVQSHVASPLGLGLPYGQAMCKSLIKHQLSLWVYRN